MERLSIGPADTVEVKEEGKESKFIPQEDILRFLGEKLIKDGESWDRALSRELGCTIIPEDRPKKLYN